MFFGLFWYACFCSQEQTTATQDLAQNKTDLEIWDHTIVLSSLYEKYPTIKHLYTEFKKNEKQPRYGEFGETRHDENFTNSALDLIIEEIDYVKTEFLDQYRELGYNELNEEDIAVEDTKQKIREDKNIKRSPTSSQLSTLGKNKKNVLLQRARNNVALENARKHVGLQRAQEGKNLQRALEYLTLLHTKYVLEDKIKTLKKECEEKKRPFEEELQVNNEEAKIIKKGETELQVNNEEAKIIKNGWNTTRCFSVNEQNMIEKLKQKLKNVLYYLFNEPNIQDLLYNVNISLSLIKEIEMIDTVWENKLKEKKSIEEKCNKTAQEIMQTAQSEKLDVMREQFNGKFEVLRRFKISLDKISEKDSAKNSSSTSSMDHVDKSEDGL